MNLKDIKLSLFPNPRAYSSELKPLWEIVRLTQYDQIIANKTDLFRKTMVVMGKHHANEHIKQKQVPAFSVAVTFKGLGHSGEQADHWTGLALYDIDKIGTPEELEAAFSRLSQDSHVLMLYRTISGTGLRALYAYQREPSSHAPSGHPQQAEEQRPPIDDTSWKAAFFLGNEHLAQVAGYDYDEACSDFTRLSGMAGDPNVYVNYGAEPFTIPDDLIVEHNCEHQEHGRPRKVFSPGSFQPDAEEAWQRVEQLLSEKNVAYTAGHHHDYVLHASYLFNRFGVPLENLLEWAAVEWGDYDTQERERAIRHKYKDTDKHGTWKLSGKKNRRENAMITLPELRQWLSNRLLIRYNVVTDQLLWREKGHSPSEDELPLTAPGWKAVDETEINTRRYQLAFDTGKRVLKSDVESVFNSDIARKVHPIRQYMERLPRWDRQDRVGSLAAHVHAKAAFSGQTVTEMQDYLLWTLHKWLVGMVATWMDDKLQNQAIFTIIGPQGVYKTTFFRHLLPPPLRGYFLENAHNSFSGKDDRIALSENCLVEIEEVDAIAGKELSELKGLVTSETIRERRPYGKFREQKPRLASFCASGNEQKILTDTTGNRRWLCHLVSHIDNPREWQLDYEQLYAQLRDEYLDGFQYWFNSEEEKVIAAANIPFLDISLEEQLINTRLRKPCGHESYKLMNASMIALNIFGGRIPQDSSIRKICKVMHKQNYTFVHKRNGDFFKVVEIPFDQQQNYISLQDEFVTDVPSEPQQPDTEELELPF